MYCSGEHQKQDWAGHKLVCGMFSKFTAAARAVEPRFLLGCSRGAEQFKAEDDAYYRQLVVKLTGSSADNPSISVVYIPGKGGRWQTLSLRAELCCVAGKAIIANRDFAQGEVIFVCFCRDSAR